MINVFTNDDEMFVVNDVRQLTLSDLKPIPNVSRESAEIWLSMACKLILQNQDVVLSDTEIKDKVLDQWPKFYVNQLNNFVLVFRQVESLKSVWMMPKVFVEPEIQSDQQRTIGLIREHLRIVEGLLEELG